LPAILLFVSSSVSSKTFETLASGNWSDSSVWVNSDIPSYTILDTVILKDSIRFDHDISLTDNSMMLIDRGGGLCGHHKISLHNGSSLHNAGILEVDSLIIFEGYFLNFGRGELLWNNIMILTSEEGGTGSAYFTDSSHGCGCHWDDCFVAPLHEYEGNPVQAHNEPIPDCHAKAYPSVDEGNLKLEYNLFTSAWFTMYNTTGQLLEERELKNSSGIESIHTETLNNGLYLWIVRIGDHVCGRGKLIVTH